MMPKWFQRETKLNPFGALPDWIRSVFRLRDRDVPRELVMDAVMPVLNVLDVASRGVGDTLVVLAGTTVQLPNIPGALLLVQADPNNAGDTNVGFGVGNVAVVLPAGGDVEVSLPNLNVFFVSPAGAFNVTVHFAVLQPV